MKSIAAPASAITPKMIPDAENNNETARPPGSVPINVTLRKDTLERTNSCVRGHRCAALGTEMNIWIVGKHAVHAQLLLILICRRLRNWFRFRWHGVVKRLKPLLPHPRVFLVGLKVEAHQDVVVRATFHVANVVGQLAQRV